MEKPLIVAGKMSARIRLPQQGDTMADIKEVVERVLALGGEAASLDDLVHETASVTASNINNAGLEAQVEYLLEQGIPEEAIYGEIL